MPVRNASEAVEVAGHCDGAFQAVRDQFERNFGERGELGASVCVIHEGSTVVDLWGGSADLAGSTPWLEDTMVIVFSCTKGATALCAHMLASRGELDLDAAVSSYWPAFNQNGKADITVRMLLNHQAGLPGLRAPLPPEAIYDFDRMVTLLESERPFWRPGTRHGYHAVTFGWLVGEVIRRVSGESVGTFFRRNVAEPLGLEFFIGLPAAEEPRVATTVMAGDASLSPRFGEALARGEEIQTSAANTTSAFLELGACDKRTAHAVEIPAANGVTNARGLAGMYAPLAGASPIAGGVTLVSEDQLVEMGATESAGLEDAVTFEPARYSPGFEKAAVGRAGLAGNPGLILSEPAFGHAGMGGSIGFADPLGRFAFGYALNRHPGGDESPTGRCQPLIDATYRALEYRSYASGKWA